MADWREKITSISKTKGTSAPEGAKRAGLGCLGLIVAVVSILTLLITIGLFKSGYALMGIFAVAFLLVCIATTVLLLAPNKHNPL
ncbi:hypothetical protein A1A1_06452 [Planococcus antarcticus DSM 14505]|uniref:Uncharacterized protein n=1 Tax=Planococcus antarcticus DSM 14505 TaxID=1185653 RepID=A0A1C7DF07_9BACL|nr:hypothetical protein [Planococcus antarcticus]ANU09997.1 hypothetical protein BBH88_06635 [Planococcus antarcticus DSM 14505]EIM07422.1 hypothetical protein A1A1_06452 [Planococcus antarcticus DSM 14505]